AVTEMTTCRASCSEFRAFLAEEPQVATGMVDHLLCVSHRSGERLRSIGVNTAVERLAAYFVDGPLPQVEPGKIRLPLTRRELAALLGTTPETVARSLHTLVVEELIAVDGSEISILDTDGLILRADGEESHTENHSPPQPPGRPDDSS
ncbi:MAG: Crp/Fnr family transcriptional regulator, partial [Planctomycetota bacterium]